MAGWRWATRPAWWIPSPAKASTTPSARPTWRRARCCPKSASWPTKLRHYRALLRRDFAADLEFGSRLAKRVFLGRFLFGSVPARMVQFTRPQPAFLRHHAGSVRGQQPYAGLEAPPAAKPERQPLEIGMSLGFSRLVPAQSRRTMNHTTAPKKLFRRAQELIPGGVNSPVRAFRSVGGNPPFIARGEGSHIFDVDGNEYIDYVGSWGPLLLGHRHPGDSGGARARARHRHQFRRAHRAGGRTGRGHPRCRAVHRDGAAGEFRHRSHHVRHPPGARLHRARPHREIRRLLPRPRGFAAGEGRLRRGHAGHCRHAGVPKSFLRHHHRAAVQFDAAAVEEAFRAHGGRIAAVIVEPVVGNMGCVPPAAGFPGSAARDHAAARRAADFRRGDDRFPRGLRRRAAAVRHPARSDHAGQSDRRRLAGGRLWRPQGHHEPGGAVRAGLPGGHAFRQSAGGGRRPGHAAASEGASGNLRSTGSARRRVCAPPRPPASR